MRIPFLTSKGNPTEAPKEPASQLDLMNRREAMGRILGFTLAIAAPSVALAARTSQPAVHPERFDLAQLLDPTDPNKLAPGQQDYSALLPESRPPLFSCEDVTNKDRGAPPVTLDINSPSIVFEAFKTFQLGLKSHLDTIEDRLKKLEFIKKNIENWKVQAKAWPKGSVAQKELAEKNKALASIYEAEFPLNEKLKKMWTKINEPMAALRGLVKQTVLLERTAGQALQRCAVQQPDINTSLSLVDIKAQPPASVLNSYPELATLVFEPFTCTPVTDAEAADDTVLTYSDLFEKFKFLEKSILAQIHMAAQREDAFLQIEYQARGLVATHPLKTVLTDIYTQGRRHNTPIRANWERILVTLMPLKKLVQIAVNTENTGARPIRRCQ